MCAFPSRRRASLLAVTSEPPWPLESGGHLRTYHLLRMLARRFDVRVLAPTSSEDDGVHAALECVGLQPRLVQVPRRSALTEAFKVATAAVRREPYVLFARHRHRAVARALQEEAEHRRPDVIYLDHLDSLAYSGTRPGIPLIIDMHNVYSRLASRAAEEAGDGLRRRYLKREAALIARMEQRAAHTAHTLLAVSEGDARYFSALGAPRVAVVPNGVDCDAYAGAPAARTGPPTILYVGSLGWPPNASAARFLATDVLPAVRRRIPDVRLVIVGRNPPIEVRALARDDTRVHIVGDAPDVIPYFRDAEVLAVPLESGGGTRLKILEAFAAGLVVVSTPVGCEGIAANDGEHLVVANRSGFAEAIVGLFGDPARGVKLANRARHLARERYDWSVVGTVASEAVAAAAQSARPVSAGVRSLTAHTSATAR